MPDIKRFRKERFHSHHLIPWSVVEKANRIQNEADRIEMILLWMDTNHSSYKFREGEVVAHKDYLTQKLYVNAILVSNITMPSQKKFTKMRGIECYWWEDCPCVDDVEYKTVDAAAAPELQKKP